MSDSNSGVRRQSTYCRICEPICGLIATVDNGRLVQLEPNRDHVLSQGFMCIKGRSMPELIYDPDRILTPMRRNGPPGSFEPISWGEAITEISAKLKALVDTHGSDAFASFVGNPPAFDFASYMWLQGFHETLGSPWKFGVNAEDAATRMAASALLYGSPAMLMMPDLWHTDMAVIIGANPMVSHGSILSEPRLRDALRGIVNRGGRVVVIDPRRSETARQFEHVGVHAGTDAWLLAAIVHVLFRDDLVAREFTRRWTTNIELLERAVKAITPRVAAPRCGVPVDQIEDLAGAIARAPSAVIYGRTGTCTQMFGTLTNYLQDVINILTGNLDARGGWVFPWGPIDFVKFAAMAGMDTFGAIRTRVSGLPDVNGLLPSRALAEDIMCDRPDRIRALCTMGANPVLSSGGGGVRLEGALGELDLHFSFDLYQNETNKYANYLLPVPSMYERQDIPFAFMGNMLRPAAFATDAVIEPLGMCRPEWTVLNDIARSMGLGGAYSVAPLRWLAKAGIRLKPRTLVDLILRTSRCGDLFGLRRGGLSFAKLLDSPDGVSLRTELPVGVIGKYLQTPDRRIDLAPAAMRAEFARLQDKGPDCAMTASYPLWLVGRRESHSHNSWMHNNKRLWPAKRSAQRLQIHPEDAKRAGLSDGEVARVDSPGGSVTVTVEVTEEMFEGNVSLPHGWGHAGGWQHANSLGGANSNVLSGGDDWSIEPIAGMSVLNGIPVRAVSLNSGVGAPASASRSETAAPVT